MDFFLKKHTVKEFSEINFFKFSRTSSSFGFSHPRSERRIGFLIEIEHGFFIAPSIALIYKVIIFISDKKKVK